MRNGDNFIECTGNKIRQELFIENLHKMFYHGRLHRRLLNRCDFSG